MTWLNGVWPHQATLVSRKTSVAALERPSQLEAPGRRWGIEVALIFTPSTSRHRLLREAEVREGSVAVPVEDDPRHPSVADMQHVGSRSLASFPYPAYIQPA